MRLEKIADQYGTVTEYNIALLHRYANMIEEEDRDGDTRRQIAEIYEVARKAHMTLAGKGGLKKIDERIEVIRGMTENIDPYGYRLNLCHALMTAVMKTTDFHIPWNAYMDTAAYAMLWLEYIDEKGRESE